MISLPEHSSPSFCVMLSDRGAPWPLSDEGDVAMCLPRELLILKAWFFWANPHGHNVAHNPERVEQNGASQGSSIYLTS